MFTQAVSELPPLIRRHYFVSRELIACIPSNQSDASTEPFIQCSVLALCYQSPLAFAVFHGDDR